jgi:site-specific recombinase XerD
MATVKVLLHPTNKNKDGRRAIVLRLTINRIKYFIDLGFDVKLLKDQLDGGQIKANSGIKNRNKINASIAKKLSDAHEVLLDLDRKNLPVTIESFKKNFFKQKTKDYVIPYFENYISELEQKGRAGNASIYITVKNSLQKFRPNKSLRFSDIDLIFLRKYEQYLHSKGMVGNGISTYMRTLRALYNRAIGEDTADRNLYPFKNTFNPNGYQISELETNTSKRAITLEEIKRIIDFDTKQLTAIHDARMYFIFSFLARGMNFTDMAHLNQENIINNRIYYTRAKTRGKQSTSFEILPQMQEILNYFKIHPSKGDYLFPILDSKKHKTKQQQRDRIKTVLRRVNRKLKDIGDALEIEIPLSTYVTRHSWATLQKHQGEPEALISQGLMHNNVQTTQIYLKSFGNTPLDEMNKRLADKVYS